MKTFSILTAVAVLACAGGAAQAAITWDFSTDNLHGWTVLNGAHDFSGNGVNAGGKIDGNSPWAQVGGFAHDAPHQTFLLESPAFNFTGGNALSGGTAMRVLTEGGQGKQGGSVGDPANPAAVLSFVGIGPGAAPPNPTAGYANSNGLKGVALLNTTTGNYDRIFYDPGNGGGVQTVAENTGTLSGGGVNLAQQYKLHIFENDSGSWGWTRFNQIEVDGAFGPVTHEVGGDNTIGTETLDGTQSNEVFGPAPTGRFVQVKNNGTANRRMDIGEIEAFAVGVTPTVDNAGDNQPLNPSIDLAYTGNGASNYAQGADSGFSQPHGSNTLNLINAQETDGGGTWSSQGVGNFVTIDLGTTSSIGTVRVHQRNGCCNDRLRDFSVNIFADDGSGNPGALLATASYPGQPPNERFGELLLASLVSADVSAQLQPWNAGMGYTYVFELGSADMIKVDDFGQPGVFNTILDINDADIVVEALGPLPAGEVFQLLSADEIIGQYHSLTLPPGVFEFGNFNETGAVTTQVIPEPITMLAVGLSLTGLGGYIRRRRRA